MTLDLELAPNTADVWQLWGNQNIGLAQLRSSQALLCAAWKWHDDSRIQFERGPVYGGSLDGIYEAVDTADAVVTWNGDKFDIPHLNREFLEHGYSRPKPFESIDLLKTSRKVFNFPSNKLDYVANRLLGVGKMPHQGHQLWVDVMAGDEAAWQIMEEYNRKDVYITERVYDRFLPWILKFPNLRLYDEHEGCPRCGSDRLQKRGFKSTSVSRFQQYRCEGCGSWSYDTKRVKATAIC